MPCGCEGGPPRVGRGLVTSGDLAAAPPPTGPLSPEDEHLARYRLVTADGERKYATYQEAAQAQGTLGGRLRTVA